MNQSIKVSVLIPVYGVEKYIERCARSLFEQTMKDGIEFIFTNDATPDRSMEILLETLEDYPERKPQVSILNHEQNRGLGATRKTGFLASRGEYIIHCDSDDWVEPNMYEMMYKEGKRTKADIIGCDYIEEYADRSSIFRQRFDLSPEKQFMGIIGRNHSEMNVTVWCRMFRSSFYAKFGLIVPDMNRDEDVLISVSAHALATRVGNVPMALYHYNLANPNSIMADDSNDTLSNKIMVWDYLYRFLSSSSHWKYPERELTLRLLDLKRDLIRTRKMFDPDRWRALWVDLPVYKYTLPKTKIVMWLAKNGYDRILKLLAK